MMHTTHVSACASKYFLNIHVQHTHSTRNKILEGPRSKVPKSKYWKFHKKAIKYLHTHEHKIKNLNFLQLLKHILRVFPEYLWVSPLCSLPQDEQTPLIHRAIIYGELDTFTDLIEEKGIDPCLSDHVSISTVSVHHKPHLHILTRIGIGIKGLV